MKTEELIACLAADATPVEPHALRWQFAVALASGAAGAAALMAIVLGPRPDMATAVVLPMFWLKLAFPAAVAVLATCCVARLGRPGARAWSCAMAIALLVGLLWALAAAVLMQAVPQERTALVLGSSWRVCPVLIALVAAPPMATVLLLLKRLAPTRLALAGAAAGALAGAIGAFVYALHCTEMQAPFIAIWYVAGMALPAVVGALLGPRLLHW
jgi:hypothetical protein